MEHVMKKLTIALVATTALAFPALAAPNSQSPRMKEHQAAAQKWVSPATLSRKEIRQMQTALNNKGFNAGRVDGLWGPHTRMALRRLEKHDRMQANGRIDKQVLSVLDVTTARTRRSAQSNQNEKAQPTKASQTAQSKQNKTKASTVGSGSSEEATHASNSTIRSATMSGNNMGDQSKKLNDQQK
jgi:peptidoglycan hydrolase-like protein with peptidoglycan-binding domain